MRKEYNKLVRDNIPEILNKEYEKGNVTGFEIKQMQESNDDNDWYEMLVQKLQEEVDEFKESTDLEELADIMDVVESIVFDFYNTSESTWRETRENKKKRGLFKDRIKLLYVDEKDSDDG